MDDNELRDLNDHQRGIIRNFSDITNITDLNLCRSILYNNDWNLELSVENFIRNRDIRQTVQSSSSRDIGDQSDRSSRVRTSQNNGIFDSLINSLRWLFQYSPTPNNPQQERRDVSRFCDKFKLDYGEDGPPFQDATYLSTIDEAFRQAKFVIMYLHSPLHDDTERFCR